MHRLEVGSYTPFISETPKDDAGMILVALHQRYGTIHMGFTPCRVFAHHLVCIAIAMTLLICLVHHIDAVAVAQFIQIRTVGIVAGAQEIDVCQFHHLQVFFVCGIIHFTSCARMMVVAVHTTQFHTLPVNLQHFAHAFHSLHAQVVVEMFHHCSLLVNQFHTERIEIGLFCRPQQRLVQLTGKLQVGGVSRSEAFQRSLQFPVVDAEDDLEVLRNFLAGIAQRDVCLHLSL